MAELKDSNELSFAEVEEIVFLLKNASDFDLSGYTRSSLKRRIQKDHEFGGYGYGGFKECANQCGGISAILYTGSYGQCYRDVSRSRLL